MVSSSIRGNDDDGMVCMEVCGKKQLDLVDQSPKSNESMEIRVNCDLRNDRSGNDLASWDYGMGLTGTMNLLSAKT